MDHIFSGVYYKHIQTVLQFLDFTLNIDFLESTKGEIEFLKKCFMKR